MPDRILMECEHCNHPYWTLFNVVMVKCFNCKKWNFPNSILGLGKTKV